MWKELNKEVQVKQGLGLERSSTGSVARMVAWNLPEYGTLGNTVAGNAALRQRGGSL
jgi:hypothetical protein